MKELPYNQSPENDLTMNEKNLNYLKDNMKYMGFGDKPCAELENNIKQSFPEFVLNHEAEFFGQKMNTLLHFKKSDQTDNYFFNKYNAELKHPNNKEEDRTHTFYLNKGNSITLKEAFNLLNGRAVNKDFVNKEGQEYNAWVQFDMSQKDNGNYKINQYHENYKYDLQAEVKNLMLKPMEGEQEKQLLSSLTKGNVQSVTMMKGTEEVKCSSKPTRSIRLSISTTAK